MRYSQQLHSLPSYHIQAERLREARRRTESNAHGSTSASESVDGGVPSRPASRGGVERQQSRFAQFQAEVAAAGAAPPGGGQFPSHHASYRPPVFELGQIRDSSNEDDDETLD